MLFDSDYEVLLADTLKSKKIHYQLRYQVYCQETGFENPDNYLSPLENDEHDAKSVHFICRNKKGDWLGAIRLVIADADLIPSFQNMEEDQLDRERIVGLADKYDQTKVVEISRLCVLKEYRTKAKTGFARKLGEISDTAFGAAKAERLSGKCQSEIMLGLLRAAYTYCLKHNLNVCLFSVTKALSRILERMGFNFSAAGEACEYHGLRVPYLCEIPFFLSGMSDRVPELYQMFNQSASAYRSFAYVDTSRDESSSAPTCLPPSPIGLAC